MTAANVIATRRALEGAGVKFIDKNTTSLHLGDPLCLDAGLLCCGCDLSYIDVALTM